MNILWRRLDVPGHEAARLIRTADGWSLAGCAVFLHERQPARLDYLIDCDGSWRTRSALIAGWVGTREVFCDIRAGEEWTLNGEPVHAVKGAIDIDLNFSPSTNLLPIRRLALDVGGEGAVRAAWLRFPSFRLEPLEQTYRRESEDVYRYESAGGKFTSRLTVNEAGFVTEYPEYWRAEKQ